MNTSLSLKLLVGLTILSTVSSPAFAQGRPDKQEKRAERKAEVQQKRALNQANDAQRAQQRAFKDQQRNVQNAQRDQQRALTNQRRDQQRAIEQQQRAMHDRMRDQQRDQRRAENRNNVPPRPTARDDRGRWDNNQRWDNRADNRADRKWDKELNKRVRQQAALDRRFRNWNDQRDYLKANLRKINQIAKLNAIQQQQLNAQMQAAYLAYHNNNWNGPYNWDYYSEPQFLDYLQVNQPSLLDRILGYLGMGSVAGYGNNYGYGNGYLYSSDWGVERSQLAQNMSRIHQLALEGRITPLQEQQLLAQMRAEFGAYHNNNWNGNYGWSQYSDPGFIDYLNTSRPSILTTIRSYLGM